MVKSICIFLRIPACGVDALIATGPSATEINPKPKQPDSNTSVIGAGHSDRSSIIGEVDVKFSKSHLGGINVQTGKAFQSGDKIKIQREPNSATV